MINIFVNVDVRVFVEVNGGVIGAICAVTICFKFGLIFGSE